jgi:hypothetical protein
LSLRGTLRKYAPDPAKDIARRAMPMAEDRSDYPFAWGALQKYRTLETQMHLGEKKISEGRDVLVYYLKTEVPLKDFEKAA